MLIEEINLEEEQQIEYYHLIRIDRPSIEKAYDFLAFLNKIVRNMVSAKLTFLQNPQQNQVLHKIIDSQLVTQQLSNLWCSILSQPSKRILAEFRLFLDEATHISSAFMEIVSNDVTEELLKMHQYGFYEIQIQIQAVRAVLFCVSNQIKVFQKYDQVLSELQHFAKYQNINQAPQYFRLHQHRYLQQLKLLKKNINHLENNLLTKYNQQSIPPSSCKNATKFITITTFLFSLPIFLFGLVNFRDYSILAQHWNLWASSGSYFIYCWIKIALYQYGLTKRVHPLFSFRCQSKRHQVFLKRQFVWYTLLVETTLFLWLFMVYLFFQPTQFLPMAANCLALLCFCFEVAYGVYHIEIIESLMFKCSFYEFAAVFPIVSEVVFNAGFFLLFEAECSRNNAFRKSVYLLGTVSIVLIRLSYFYHRTENGQNLSKLKEEIQQKRKQQRQLKNRIKEKKKSLQPILNDFNQTLSNIQRKKKDLLSTLNSMDEGRRLDRVQLQISMNKLNQVHDDNLNYETTNRINQNYQEYESQQLKKILLDLQQKQKQLTYSSTIVLQQQLGKYQRQLSNIQQNLITLQNKLQSLSKQLKQQQIFGIFYFFILIVQIGFLFDQSDAIAAVNIILGAICLIFLGRRIILFCFNLLWIRCKIILKMVDSSYLINKNTFNLCLEIFGLIICILSNITFIFGVYSCFFERLLEWRKYIILAINVIVYIVHSIIVIGSTADFMRHPFSGLVSINKFKQLQQDSKELISCLKTAQDQLRGKALIKDFEERRKALNHTLPFSEQLDSQYAYLEQIKRKMDVGQLRAFIKPYQQ